MHEEAMKAYEEAARANPNNTPARYSKVLAYSPVTKEIIKEGEGPKPVIGPLQMATRAY